MIGVLVVSYIVKNSCIYLDVGIIILVLVWVIFDWNDFQVVINDFEII